MSDDASTPGTPAAPGTSPGPGKKIESFAGTGSRVLGVIVLAIAGLAIVDILIEWRTLQGLSAAAITVALGTLVWMSMVRPAVVVFERAVVLRNFVRDVEIPWHLMKDVEIKPVLTVTAEHDKLYRSIAVAASGADRRAEMRARRQAAKASAAGMEVGRSGQVDPNTRPPSEYAVERIRAVAEQNREQSRELAQVRRRWVAPELIVAFASGLIGFLTSLA